FFSSRRRHTRSKRDWSSDVCSSDLVDSGVVRSSTGYVFNFVNRSVDIAHPADINQKAFLLYALASAGGRDAAAVPVRALFEQQRSEERRVGKECRARWARGEQRKRN